MTATTKPHGRAGRRRPVRFSSMENLGFTDTSSTWSDHPLQTSVAPPPRPEPTADTSIAEWEPSELGDRLGGRDLRWGVLIAALMLMVGTGVFAFWLYQRPAAAARAAVAQLDTEARELSGSLPRLVDLGTGLTNRSADVSGIDLSPVGDTARRLFDAGAALPDTEAQARTLATGAASAALDGIRVATEARSYAVAVSPILTVPALETDPAVIELDDAARWFGAWQLRFDGVRTALPESVFPSVTQQLDVLSGDLAAILGRYVDRLRSDEPTAAQAVVLELENRLDNMSQALDVALTEAQDRVLERVSEARAALDTILEH